MRQGTAKTTGGICYLLLLNRKKEEEGSGQGLDPVGGRHADRWIMPDRRRPTAWLDTKAGASRQIFQLYRCEEENLRQRDKFEASQPTAGGGLGWKKGEGARGTRDE